MILKTYHVCFVSGGVVDRIEDSVHGDQKHGQVTEPSMVPHSMLKRHMDQAKDRWASHHRKEEERHGKWDYCLEKLS